MTRRANITLAAVEDQPCDLPLPCEPFPSALAVEWRDTFLSAHSQAGIRGAFALGEGDAAAWHALGRLGVCFADVFLFENPGVKEAPRWRWRLYQHGQPVEAGTDAILLPVTQSGCIAQPFLGLDAWPEIADIVALPLNGTRARSYTGLTERIGMFAPDAVGCVALAANGMRWLRDYVAAARACGAECPAHLAKTAIADLPPPDLTTTLIVAPELIDWKAIASFSPAEKKFTGVKRFVCGDSAGLARRIQDALAHKEKPKPLPDVIGPATNLRSVA